MVDVLYVVEDIVEVFRVVEVYVMVAGGETVGLGNAKKATRRRAATPAIAPKVTKYRVVAGRLECLNWVATSLSSSS